MKLAGVPFYQAASSNYTKGRTAPVRKLTIHHSAGWEATLRYLWADPNRNGSSHFWVGNLVGQIEQYVDTADTAWCNGNWNSNCESISVETRGDWRGYYDRGTLDNLYKLMVMLLPHYPNLILEFHQDVSTVYTLCPADLKHKGYAKAEFDKAVASFNTPAPTPTPPANAGLTYEAIAPKRVKLIRTANLWNFNFTDWQKAQAVGSPYQAGHLVDVVAIGRNALGGKYYMTAYSFNNGAIRATNGFNVVDCEDYVPQITQPPTVELKWEPMSPERKLRTVYDLTVTDLDTMAQVGSTIAKGTDIDIVEKKTLANSKMYVRSRWARDNGKNWGIPMDSLEEIKPDVPREPVPEPPLNVDPNKPTPSDAVLERIGALEKLVKYIVDFLSSIFSKFKPN